MTDDHRIQVPWIHQLSPNAGTAWRSSVFRAIAPRIPGYDSLLGAQASVEALEAIEPESYEVAVTRAAEMLLDGASESDVLADLAVLERTRRAYSYKQELIRAAGAGLASRVDTWLIASADIIAKQLTADLAGVIAEGVASVRPRLRHARTIDDVVAGNDPDVLAAWAEFAAVASRFDELARFAQVFAQPTHPDGLDLPYLWLFPDYEQAWPEFYLTAELEVFSDEGKFVGRIGRQRSPWAGMTAAELLRWIVDHELRIRIATPHQLTARRKKLTARMQELRSERVRTESITHASTNVTRIPVMVSDNGGMTYQQVD